MALAADSAAPREHPLAGTPSRFWLLERWHLLSLDAPTVAALWSIFFARAMRLDLPWHAPLILALGTWLLYVTDRILDSRRPQASATLQRRHRFHARHSAAFLAAAAGVSATLLGLIALRMTPPAREEDTVLFAAALLYFFLVHKPAEDVRPWLPKELAVGIVFAAATAVPAWSRLDAAGRAALLPAIAIFAALCWLNCVAIERWEGVALSEARAGRLPGPHPTTRWVAERLGLAALSLAAIAAPAAVDAARHAPAKTAPLYLATMASASCIALLDAQRARVSRLHLRIAADAALLTPLLLLPFLN